jgi:hypothetical protein
MFGQHQFNYQLDSNNPTNMFYSLTPKKENTKRLK